MNRVEKCKEARTMDRSSYIFLSFARRDVEKSRKNLDMTLTEVRTGYLPTEHEYTTTETVRRHDMYIYFANLF
jgi:hypothetical protein